MGIVEDYIANYSAELEKEATEFAIWEMYYEDDDVRRNFIEDNSENFIDWACERQIHSFDEDAIIRDLYIKYREEQFFEYIQNRIEEKIKKGREEYYKRNSYKEDLFETL